MVVGVWCHPMVKPVLLKFVVRNFRKEAVRLPPIVSGEDRLAGFQLIVREPGRIDMKWLTKRANPSNE